MNSKARLGLVLAGVMFAVGCTGLPLPSGPDSDEPIVAPEPIPVTQVDRPTTRDGVTTTAGALFPIVDTFKQKVICSQVTISNDNEAAAIYNVLEWHIEYPDGTRQSAKIGAPDALNSGEVDQGKKVVGNICFDDKKQSGETAIVWDALFSGDEPLKWYQVV